jgi:hypothetical protein
VLFSFFFEEYVDGEGEEGDGLREKKETEDFSKAHRD